MPKSPAPDINAHVQSLVEQLKAAVPKDAKHVIRMDVTDNIIRKYLTDDNGLHLEAFEVVQNWYNYLNVYFNSLAHQLVDDNVPRVGADQVDVAFATPLFGLSGNRFWAEHAPVLINAIKQDIIDEHVMRTGADKDPGTLFYRLAYSRYKFIGQVVCLVNPKGMYAQIGFEREFRELMLALTKKALDIPTDYTGNRAGLEPT